MLCETVGRVDQLVEDPRFRPRVTGALDEVELGIGPRLVKREGVTRRAFVRPCLTILSNFDHRRRCPSFRTAIVITLLCPTRTAIEAAFSTQSRLFYLSIGLLM